QSRLPSQDSAAGEAVKSIALNQVVGAIRSGLDVWVSSLDRTAVINSLGSGDVLGGSLAESQRRTARTSGVLNTAGAAAQGVGMALAPFTMGVSLIAGTGVNLLTQIFSSLNEAEQKKYANRIAYASLWDDKKDQAMNLAAVMGNPSNVRGTWGTAASVAERYGFTAEEGAEMLKAAAYQGLGASAADRVFNYERGTGADRGVLSSVSMMSERYNGGDALRSGWAGLQASGMKSGQYTEYLRAMQRVMEDGISKGFVRSSDQVARNLTMLAQMTDNNPLWQGEHGAQRLMQIMSGFEGATALQDSNDMFAYSAAKTVLEGKGRSTDIVDVQKYLENPDDLVGLYNEFIKQIKDVEGDNRLEIVSRLIKRFGLNYTTADALYRSNGTSTEEVNRLLSRQAGIPTPSSNELRYSIETMNVRNLIIEAGQDFYDTETTKALELTRKELEETVSGNLPLTGRARQEDRARREEEAHEINDRIRRARGDTAFYRSFFSSGEDDRQARERLRGYLNEDNHPAFRAFEEASAILRAFTPEQRRAVDESNAINRAIPNVMTDRTGQQLLEAIRELADQVDVTINVE
ncbi:MAG: hypothetical protein LBI28_11160, partial [Treponema sp.]|nr:hypothetical protein [Treponema sp.]